MPQTPTRLILALTLLLVPSSGMADPSLPAIFGDRMVLQRDRAVPLWGRAAPGEQLTLTFAGQTHPARADAAGRWRVSLRPLAASAEGRALTIQGQTKTIRLQDVLVGEVWLCSGQSNMQWPLRRARDAEREIAAANAPGIRLFTVQRASSPHRSSDVKGQWQACTPDSARHFSAVAYFFGRRLQRALRLPIGLINSSWGGTRAEAWTDLGAIRAQPVLSPLLAWWDKQIAGYDAKKEQQRFRQALERWQAQRKAAPPGKRPRRRPRMRQAPATSCHRPGNLYNGMIAPLVGLAIRGVIWYQGESNVQRARQYRTIFPTLIRNWRAAWKQGDFPFYFVQLAPYRYGWVHPECCAELWGAQLMTLKTVTRTGMAVTTDLGNNRDIHPQNKQDVGARLALWALAKDYGKADVVCSGPIYAGLTIQADKATLRFDLHGSTLASRDGKPLTHFTVAGQDRRFHPAKAVINGDTIEVTCPEVPRPLAVRFGWTDTANPNLVNTQGLPASPFRTDRWPGRTDTREH